MGCASHRREVDLQALSEQYTSTGQNTTRHFMHNIHHKISVPVDGTQSKGEPDGGTRFRLQYVGRDGSVRLTKRTDRADRKVPLEAYFFEIAVKFSKPNIMAQNRLDLCDLVKRQEGEN